MAHTFDPQTGAVTINGWEAGIAPSPHKGIANMKGVNISTESEEVMANYARALHSQQFNSGIQSGAAIDTSHLSSSSISITNGIWITVTSSGITGLNPGDYYVIESTGTPGGSSTSSFQLSTSYLGTIVVWSGTIGNFNFQIKILMSKPVQAATEQYTDSSNATQYRYYVADSQGLVWVYDTGVVNSISVAKALWFLPDNIPQGNCTGLAVFNGYLHLFVGNTILVKETVLLGSAWVAFSGGNLNSAYNSNNSHFALVSQNNTLTYCDGAFLGTIESSSNSGAPATAVPIWSYGTYTYVGTNLTVSTLFAGSNLVKGSTITFTTNGTLPTGITTNTLYYVVFVQVSGNNLVFNIATTPTGAAISLSGGNGLEYFNTYNPAASAATSTYIFNAQAVSLPFTAVAQSLCEIDNTIVIGTQSNFLYLWDEIDPLTSGFIPLPENNVAYMVNVNNMAYVFAGSKGNIYVTNGSTASLALTVPDYTSGEIEPYFTWGGAAYIRGRLYFSIQDQTASHTGQCGGIWSFVPTQNFFIGQDFGLALRIENKNSYGTYNGAASVILPSATQNANGPQYWTGWYSDIANATYGIDTSSTTTLATATIETDIVPVGNYTDPANFAGIEVKLAAPLVPVESVQVFYRTNLSFGAFTSVGIMVYGDSTANLSKRFTVPFANVLWVQFQIILTPTVAASSSFVRLSEVRIFKRV